MTAAEGGLTEEQRYRHCCLAWNCSPLKVILDGEEDHFLCGSGVSLARILVEYRRWNEVEWSCVGECLPEYGMPPLRWVWFEKADEALGWLRVLCPAVWWPIDIHIGRMPKVVIRAL